MVHAVRRKKFTDEKIPSWKLQECAIQCGLKTPGVALQCVVCSRGRCTIPLPRRQILRYRTRIYTHTHMHIIYVRHTNYTAKPVNVNDEIGKEIAQLCSIEEAPMPLKLLE